MVLYGLLFILNKTSLLSSNILQLINESRRCKNIKVTQTYNPKQTFVVIVEQFTNWVDKIV